jgi:hypothetical protein
VPTKPRTKLKRPVPVVRSVITRIVSTVTAAALTPLRSCAATRAYLGRVESEILNFALMRES